MMEYASLKSTVYNFYGLFLVSGKCAGTPISYSGQFDISACVHTMYI
jgi:hypothetical protein